MPLLDTNLTANFTEPCTTTFIHKIHDQIMAELVSRSESLLAHDVSVMAFKEVWSLALGSNPIQSKPEILSLAVHSVMVLEGFASLAATRIINPEGTNAPAGTAEAATTPNDSSTSVDSSEPGSLVPAGWNKGAPRVCAFAYRHEPGLEVVVKCLSVGDCLVVSGKLTDASARPYLQAKTLTPVFTIQLPFDRFLLSNTGLTIDTCTDFLCLLGLVRNGLARRVLNPFWSASTSATASLFALPPELLMNCFGFFEARELALLTSISRAFLSAASAPILWQIQCDREKIVGEGPQTHWKNAYAGQKCEESEQVARVAAWRHRQQVIRVPRYAFLRL